MKYVYSFKEGNKDMRNILGGKGANLCEMAKIGLPVPNGFIVSTDACNNYYENNKELNDEIIKEINEKLEELEKSSGKKLGDKKNPLLVSVRSGARASMPGMMDTILNLGLNDEIVESFSEENKRFIYDSYRRFIQMFSDVVKGYDKSKFERVLDEIKKEKGIKLDIEFTKEDMKEIVLKFKDIYKEISGEEFPQDTKYQLIEAIKSVFNSWNNERANIYRQMNNIPYSWGTAVNVQQMVYGNLNEKSGSGVAFSRNPATGENELFGEYLINAQGEDIVAGIRTPNPIKTLEKYNKDLYEEFYGYAKKLEEHYKDMQDMEFTIEDGKLYILQTRNGKRTAKAAVKIAVDLVKEGLITKEEALLSVDASTLSQLLHKSFDEEDLKTKTPIGKGLAASPGAGVGKIYFNSKDLKDEDSILVRLETSPEDIEGMKKANGILTIRGGMTSHAAVVARQMGECCVSGLNDAYASEKEKVLKIGDIVLTEGDYISIDGNTGNVYKGQIKTKDAEIEGEFEEFMSWTNEYSRIIVRANADSEKDALNAKRLGAQGIGLCRTEHMFFEKERIFNFRRMILSETKEEREEALSKILPYQQSDFEKLFTVMNNEKVVIRYLDPPLHEFLPKEESEIKELAESLNISLEEIHDRISELKEFNPMMGHRGVRLAITYPEIAIMQTKAVINAAVNVKKNGNNPIVDIMIPLIGDDVELKYVKNIIKTEADKILKENNIDIEYKIGTMIEIPRAIIISDLLGKECDFFSYGTNDLTQLTFGFSRDDSGKFLKDYYDKKIFESDPFKSVDEKGVLRLVNISKEKAKLANPNIELGVCGEHAGDPKSIENFDRIGLDYVSCSAFRVPGARLASAQSNIKNSK